MGDQELLRDEVIGQVDWENLCHVLQDGDNTFDYESPLVVDSSSLQNLPNSSSDSVPSWIGEIENLLMKDDEDKVASEPYQQLCDNFLADILLDSPADGSGEIVDNSMDKESSASDNETGGSEEKQKDEQKIFDDGAEVNNDDEHPDDPISKKRRRQLRNRDAAVRSRERKKMYVRDLEMKSKYLEGECRRLGRLLQCFVAENQALRYSLQKGNAFGATSTKQESAVLLLESLLLGSLLWFLGIMCLFTLPPVPQSMLGESVGMAIARKVAPRGAGSEVFISVAVQSFIKTRKCKASRTRMKPRHHFVGVLV